MTEQQIVVRATVHLPGLGVGQEALADPTDPYVAECLEHALVVPVDHTEGVSTDG